MKRVMKRKVPAVHPVVSAALPNPARLHAARRGNAKAGAAVDASGAKLGVERDARALGANTIVESEEKREPASDIDTGVVDGLKVLVTRTAD